MLRSLYHESASGVSALYLYVFIYVGLEFSRAQILFRKCTFTDQLSLATLYDKRQDHITNNTRLLSAYERVLRSRLPPSMTLWFWNTYFERYTSYLHRTRPSFSTPSSTLLSLTSQTLRT